MTTRCASLHSLRAATTKNTDNSDDNVAVIKVPGRPGSRKNNARRAEESDQESAEHCAAVDSRTFINASRGCTAPQRVSILYPAEQILVEGQQTSELRRARLVVKCLGQFEGLRGLVAPATLRTGARQFAAIALLVARHASGRRVMAAVIVAARVRRANAGGLSFAAHVQQAQHPGALRKRRQRKQHRPKGDRLLQFLPATEHNELQRS